MSNGGNNKRGRGGSNQQRRRRSGGNNTRPQAPSGPAMTALGESTYEAVFDHGGNGYGVWFDGVVRDDPMYKQYWKGTGMRPLYVRIEEDKIVLLKQLDRELPQTYQATQEGEAESSSLDVDAAIEEAVAEAIAAAENVAPEDTEKVYSPEEAAALFAATEEAPAVEAKEEKIEEEPEKPAPKAKTTRKRAVTRKASPKKPAADSDE